MFLQLLQNLEEKHALRVQLENAVEDLWMQFKAALTNYQETTEERKKAFEELKAKDEKSAKEIEMQMRKLQRISVSVGVYSYCAFSPSWSSHQFPPMLLAVMNN